jgi:hypothetical protein
MTVMMNMGRDGLTAQQRTEMMHDISKLFRPTNRTTYQRRLRCLKRFEVGNATQDPF